MQIIDSGSRRRNDSGVSKKEAKVQGVIEETEWKETRGREEDAWRLEPEGETEMPETRVVADGVEGIYVDLNCANFVCVVARSTNAEVQHNDMMMWTNVQMT